MVIHTVAAIIFKNKRQEVLLVKHKEGRLKGNIGFPAGQVTDDTEINTLIQKLDNVTGIKVTETLIKELPFFYTDNIKNEDGVVRSFSMKIFLVDMIIHFKTLKYCKAFSAHTTIVSILPLLRRTLNPSSNEWLLSEVFTYLTRLEVALCERII